ncbi:MAG TPA: hypothetical protein VKP30_15465, partial [Polyangiaceae bacterium]|nr:hypothetical protein [Polyangiaceae bacterium]
KSLESPGVREPGPQSEPDQQQGRRAEQAVSAAHSSGQPASANQPHTALDAQLDEMMGDAPVCDSCGHITVRNGACYKCLNCGNSMGCS